MEPNNTNPKKPSSINPFQIAIVVFFISVGLFIIFYFALAKPFNDWSFIPDSNLFSQYGNFIGGLVGTLFSLVAVFLLYRTLVTQQKTLNNQYEMLLNHKEVSDADIFERTFFNLLKTQQEIKREIYAYFFGFNKDFREYSRIVKGVDFFISSKLELIRIWKSINSEKFPGVYDKIEISNLDGTLQYISDIYDPGSPRFIHDYYARIEEEKNQRQYQDLIFANYFYGITQYEWTEINSLLTPDRIEKMYRYYFEKYHYAIGHYFRHLYHILKFAKNYNAKLSDRKRSAAKYIAFVQAQMSSFELMLVFYNSFSFPKMQNLIHEFNFLDNLAEEDLIDPSHNCIEGMKLKPRGELLGSK